MSTIEDQVRTTLRAVSAGAEVPPVPTLDQPSVRPDPLAAPSSTRRRHVVVGAALAGLLVPVGAVGAAAATGSAPEFLQRLFGGQGETVTSYRLAGSLPLPGDKRYDVWSVDLSDGSECVVDDVVPADAPTTAPVEPEGGAAGMCQGGSRAASDLPFGAPSSIAAEGEDVSFAVHAGDAVRATLELPDGTVLGTVVGDGLVHGWVPADLEGTPVLTAYDADGEVVGTRRLTELRRMLEVPSLEDAVEVEVTPSPGRTEGSVSGSGGGR